MKKLIFWGVVVLIAWSCTPAKQTGKSSALVSKTAQDTSEYELFVLDPEFDHWYLVNYSQSKDLTKEYYRQQNLIAVSNWNSYYRDGRYRLIIESYLDYWPSIDYGLELNRKLFWYFTFITERYKIQLFR